MKIVEIRTDRGGAVIHAHLTRRGCNEPFRGILKERHGITGECDPYITYTDGKGRPGLLCVSTIESYGAEVVPID